MAGVRLYTKDDMKGLRAAGKLAAETLDMIGEHVQAGVTTEELNQIVHDFTIKNGATPAPLNYKGFPKSCCISLNHTVCHGIPGDRELIDGDILNIDVTSILDGWYGDTSRMYVVGKPSIKAKNLITWTYEALMAGVAQVKPGNTLGDIGHAIETLADKHRLGIVREFCGHGIGRVFHDQPNVLHYGRPGSGMKLEEGMVFTIEPMLNLGGEDVKVLQDGWTAVTRDKSLSAQFEHTLAVTDKGCEIFTLSPKDIMCPSF